jgi:hypothetical protein
VREHDTDPPSFLGIVEGFPQIMTHSTSVERAEFDLTNALVNHLERLQDRESTRIEWDDFPTVRTLRVIGIATSVGISFDATKHTTGIERRAQNPGRIGS